MPTISEETNFFKLGLFSIDLTDFIEECQSTDGCDNDYYSEYWDGWTLGTVFYTIGTWDLEDKT